MEKGSFAVKKSTGITLTEQSLARLSERTFLSLWSYPNIWRDQGIGKGGDGKEVCDLIVVFENHIIIFSDKHIKFNPHIDPKLAWQRWYKAAVKESANQIYGAERWIQNYPNRLFLDKGCIQPFPIPLPSPDQMKVHRIVVAHGASEACREYYGGGSGSLIINPSLVGDDHLLNENETIEAYGTEIKNPNQPFQIGQVDPQRGYVHVLDDTTLEVLFKTLDTVRDLVEYLERKERFITSEKLVSAASEEDLLAYYLQNVGKDNRNDFIVPQGFDFVSIDEGLWSDFQKSSQRLNQLKADEISYAWDSLIERFNKHILEDTPYDSSDRGVHYNEKLVRFLAQEPRTLRRVLAESLINLYENNSGDLLNARVVRSSRNMDLYYVFMIMKYTDNVSYEHYRQKRRYYLSEYMNVTKIEFPKAKDIVGIAIGKDDNSEDLLYLDACNWSEEDQRQAETTQEATGFLKKTNTFSRSIKTFPDTSSLEKFPKIRLKGRERNKPCPCGNGRKYKHCHGKNKSAF